MLAHRNLPVGCAALVGLVSLLLLPLAAGAAAGAAAVSPPATSPIPPPIALSTKSVPLLVRPEPATEALRAAATNSTDPSPFQARLTEAAKAKLELDPRGAEKIFVALLATNAPAAIHRSAMLELALLAEEARQFAKAQQILAQFLRRFPDDPAGPEVLMRQGLAYRELGANVMALSKFYAVMSTALSLKIEDLKHYQRVVLRAQTEIAETYFLQGKLEEAADFFKRLLQLEDPDLNKQHVRFKLIHALSNLSRHTDVATQARTFIERHPQAGEIPEVRFLLAAALKKLGRTREAMQEVMTLLESQQGRAASQPENWIYWQQRTGNDIANQLYKEGDHLNALQIYQNLAGLSEAPEWQLPVLYQIGLVYERLLQPQLAAEAYGKITSRAKDFGTNTPAPSLVAVMEMARWRKDHLEWQNKAELERLQLKFPPVLIRSTNSDSSDSSDSSNSSNSSNSSTNSP